MHNFQKLYEKLKQEKQKRLVDKQIYNWDIQARKNQIPPDGNWTTWLILAGRGFGKTRTGSETIRRWVHNQKSKRIALIGGCINEVVNIMLKGESGLLTISPKNERPKFMTDTNTLHWANGAVAQLISASNPEKLRGPQFDTAWVDELAKFKKAPELWNQLMLGLRLGKNPRCIVTTTPRPTPLIKSLINHSKTIITRGTTFDNEKNLSPHYMTHILNEFQSTQLGSQEIYGHILDQQEGALWKRSIIQYDDCVKNFKRIIIAIDPAETHHQHSDETGIITAGLGHDDKVYILQDDSGTYSPLEWGTKVHDVYRQYKADRIIAEINKGGDMVESILRNIDKNISYKGVRASRGKHLRAEPVVALYEQNRVLHKKPFLKLEDQMCTYVANISRKSPDRMDALVWAITELLLLPKKTSPIRVWI